MKLTLLSFGYKAGIPEDADMVFDVRCLPNPYWEEGLSTLTGKDPAVIAFMESQPTATTMVQSLCSFLRLWMPVFESNARRSLTVAVGCTGGRHRSVFVAERVGASLMSHAGGVVVRHREIA